MNSFPKLPPYDSLSCGTKFYSESRMRDYVAADRAQRQAVQEPTKEQIDTWMKHPCVIEAAPQPAQVPLTNHKLLELLKLIDPQTARLPAGFRQFACAIEQAHGIYPR